MADAEFSLPKSSLPELLKMVHAYFLADQQAKGESLSVPDVASRGGMDRTTLSRNNKFLTSAGIIEGGQKKRLTELGRRLGLAISHEDDQLQQEALAALVDESDFLSKIKSAVKIRGGMDVASVQSHIAISAGVPRKPEFMTGAAAVVQLMLKAQQLVDDGGTLRAVDPPSAPRRSPSTEERLPEGEEIPTTVASSPRVRVYGGGSSGSFGSLVAPGPRRDVVVNINLNVQPDNIEVVKSLVRELLGLPERPEPSEERDAPHAED